MILNIDKSGELDQKRSQEWLVNTETGFSSANDLYICVVMFELGSESLTCRMVNTKRNDEWLQTFRLIMARTASNNNLNIWLLWPDGFLFANHFSFDAGYVSKHC